MTADTLTVTDNRTGTSYEIPIENGAINASHLRQIKASEGDFGLMSYDPGFLNTASCHSRITYIDGDVGILRYRGYPIEQLAEESTYLETTYLIFHGELPTAAELDGLELEHQPPHSAPREHQEVHRRLQVRRPPHGNAGELHRGAVDLLS